MDDITKRFPGVVANQDVHLHVRSGVLHAVIGENGAGKSTLLNILYGRYAPDAGRILLHGRDVTALLRRPADAINYGVGLVSQHHALIPALTVLENVMLGAEKPLQGPLLRPALAAQRARELAEQIGLGDFDLHVRAERLSVAAQQKVEILKCLYRRAQILLLDEPTAMLAPAEADALFELLHTLIDNGRTVVFVTHKLREVMQHSSAVTVLRAGRNAGDFQTADTTEQELLARIIKTRESESDEGVQAHPTPKLQHRTPNTGAPKSLWGHQTPEHSSPLLQLKRLAARNTRGALAVHQVDLELFPGEILGIAGVDGSGQRELAEALVGLRRLESGEIRLAGAEVSRLNVRQRADQGIAYIPEDRHHVGMVLDFTIAENYLLGHERQPLWGGGLLLHSQRIAERAVEMVRRHGVNVGTRAAETPARTLSGGNQQKVVIARALDSSPRLLVACQPTRGLDPGARDFVYDTLRAARDGGLGVILFSLDLDEVFALSDRIAVMFNGRIAGLLSRADATAETVGALMTGAGSGEPQSDLGTPAVGSGERNLSAQEEG